MADAIMFLLMLHSTCTGPFPGVISCIGVLGFGPREHIIRLYFLFPILTCRMHPSKCVESFRFFFILLLRLDMLRCNLEME